MMIDDDVPLPPDLHVPNNTLNRYPDIKAVAYVIEAATETGYDNQLVNCQDLEYKWLVCKAVSVLRRHDCLLPWRHSTVEAGCLR